MTVASVTAWPVDSFVTYAVIIDVLPGTMVVGFAVTDDTLSDGMFWLGEGKIHVPTQLPKNNSPVWGLTDNELAPIRGRL